MRALPAFLLATALAGCATPQPVVVAPAASATRSPAAPIAWQRWSKATFERAKLEQRIIVVTIATQWCHWCHVMDEETWSNDDVRRLVGDRYIAIREDADARPDLAERYAEWGWPALALMTPDGKPIAELRGYQPREKFLALLTELAGKLARGETLGRAEVDLASTPATELDEIRALTQAQLDGYYDEKAGGWAKVQKYPFAANIEEGLTRASLRGDVKAGERALFTLDQTRSLIDSVDGGLFQYSLGGVWSQPHFEKLAEVNGAMLGAYARGFAVASDATLRAGFEDAGRALHRYLTTTLRDPASGAFYANQDADVGTRGERPPMLGKAYYALDAAARAQAGAPFVDTHVYALHNGRVIAGMARFGAVVADDAIVADAARAAGAIWASHVDAHGRVAHSPIAEGSSSIVHLADQVAVAAACVELYEATLDDKWRKRALLTTKALVAALYDPAAMAFRAHTVDENTPALDIRMPVRANAEAARVVLKVGRLEEDKELTEIGRRALSALAKPALIKEEGRIVGEYLLALAEAESEPLHFALVADEPSEARTLHVAALRVNAPHRILDVQQPGAKYPDLGKPALYICGTSFCSPPITDAALVAKKAEPFLKPKA